MLSPELQDIFVRYGDNSNRRLVKIDVDLEAEVSDKENAS